jgi:hypothetical protein
MVLVAGARASELVGAPGWDELGKRLADWLDDSALKAEVVAAIESGRRAAALAYLGARVPREALVEVLRDAYPAPASVPEAAAAAARIPWRAIVTTGFDGLWAATSGEASNGVGRRRGPDVYG